jgi:hypothetical protein
MTWVDSPRNEGDNDERDTFSRIDFVHFVPSSAWSKGNKLLQERLKNEEEADSDQIPNIDEVQKLEDWEGFPQRLPHAEVTLDSLTDPRSKGLRLLAWLVGWFGDIVTHFKLKEEVQKFNPENVFANLTLDDFVFLFVQLQHNIDYWNLAYLAWKKKNYIDCWKGKSRPEECESEKKTMGKADHAKLVLLRKMGYEYPSGAGVSGRDGMARHRSMTLFLYKAYFSQKVPQDVVQRNKDALGEAVKHHTAIRRSQVPKDDFPMDGTTIESNQKDSSELDDIAEEMWGTTGVTPI